MNVKDLQRLIETLKKRMQVRSGWSEQEVRRELIDPLLQAMGWNTDDGTQVKREYQLGPGRADYALFKDASGKPSVVVEAKRLSISRRELDNAAKQGIEYCIKDGIEYFAVTDGQVWEVYETYKAVPLPDKLIVSFDLASPSGEAAMKCAHARELWAPGVIPGDNGPEPDPTPSPSPGKEFVHGIRMRVDDEGYVLTKSGRRDKRYSSEPYPPGTKWVVDGFPLGEEGWVLTPKGNPAKRFKYPCPTNTARILDWGGHRRFLDEEGYVLTKSGRRDKRYSSEPYPPGAVVFVDGFPLDEEGWILTKSGKRDERFTWPFSEYDI